MSFIGKLKLLFELPRSVKIGRSEVRVTKGTFSISALGLQVHWHPKDVINQVALNIASVRDLDSNKFLDDMRRLIPRLVYVRESQRTAQSPNVSLDYHKGALCVIVRKGRKTIAIDVFSVVDLKTPITRISLLRNKKPETVRKRIDHLLTSVKTHK